jgi:hypothetical protein
MADVLGVIAEDTTDLETVRVLIQRVRPVKVLGHASAGSSRIPTKAVAWMKDLARRGASKVLIVHDLDRDPTTGELRDEAALRRRLMNLPAPAGVTQVVCIPVKELEAWLWASDACLSRVARQPTRGLPDPAAVRGPKERFIALSRDERRQAWYTPNDNAALARLLELEVCAARCPSLRTLIAFASP